MPKTVRWSITISEETDLAVRKYLSRRGSEKSSISKFVEHSVRWRVLDRTVAETKAENLTVPPEEIENAIDEAVRHVRAADRGK